jgi:hypothetical protein
MQDDIKINPAHWNELVTLHETSELDDGIGLKDSRITAKDKLLKASGHIESLRALPNETERR